MGNGVSSPLQDDGLHEDNLLAHHANGNDFLKLEDNQLDHDHATLVKQLMMIDTRLQPNDTISDEEHSATDHALWSTPLKSAPVRVADGSLHSSIPEIFCRETSREK